MNHCIFLGRLTKDPEIRLAKESKIPIARFSIAVDRYRSHEGDASADFFPCVLFDKKAEFAEKYLCSGMRVLISGNLQNRNYTNRAGEKVYGVELIGEDVEFADGKREKNGAQESRPPKTGTPSQDVQGRTQPQRSQQGAGSGNGAPKNGRTKANNGQASAGPGSVSRQTAAKPAGKSQSARYAGRTGGAASSGFMNIPSGIEDEALPFN